MSERPPTQPRSSEPRPAVLVVDDNQANLTAMEAVLASLDVDVTKALSGEDALKQLLQQDFAVVLMDIQMPGLDGFKTTELIRQRDRTRHTPIIFVTAIFTDEASARKAYSLGALDFIHKPFDETVLRAKVSALVGHYRQAALIELQAEALRVKQRDAEREHAAREAAEEANRAKDDFLAMLSHELRAPLNSILGWSSHLQNEPGLPPKAVKGIETIARSAQAQSKIIDDLLDVSQIVAQKLQIEPTAIDLQTVVQSALATMLPAAMAKKIRVDLSVGPGSYGTVGDARRIEQLVCYLLSNALKFSDEGASVGVVLTRSEAGYRIQVKDAGIGISPDFLPYVFDRFRQRDGSRTRRHGGLGIGLAVARHLAELHGGTVEAFSAGIGTGAEFVVTLPARDPSQAVASSAPLAAGPAPPSSMAAADAPPLSGLRLLVVDDDEDMRVLSETILQDAGATVVTAASAAEALAAFAAGAFDVLVSDLGMPGQDGLTLVRSIRALDQERGGALATVAVSGYGSAEDRMQSRAAGFQAHLVKPFEPAQLIALVARLTRPA
ncbi:MAG: ATP-binding response regulator [Polyangia bacterium]